MEWRRERSCVGKMFWRTVRRPRRDHICDKISMFLFLYMVASFLVGELRYCLCLASGWVCFNLYIFGAKDEK